MATSDVTRGMTPAQRHYAMTDRDPVSGCWNWTGSDQDARGYSRFFVEGKRMLVHRWAYTHFIGAIPAGETVHHSCVNPKCSNPDHLEVMSLRDNIRESKTSISAINHRKRYCLRGHDLTGAYVNPTTGYKRCRECRNEKNRAAREAQLGQG